MDLTFIDLDLTVHPDDDPNYFTNVNGFWSYMEQLVESNKEEYLYRIRQERMNAEHSSIGNDLDNYIQSVNDLNIIKAQQRIEELGVIEDNILDNIVVTMKISFLKELIIAAEKSDLSEQDYFDLESDDDIFDLEIDETSNEMEIVDQNESDFEEDNSNEKEENNLSLQECMALYAEKEEDYVTYGMARHGLPEDFESWKYHGNNYNKLSEWLMDNEFNEVKLIKRGTLPYKSQRNIEQQGIKQQTNGYLNNRLRNKFRNNEIGWSMHKKSKNIGNIYSPNFHFRKYLVFKIKPMSLRDIHVVKSHMLGRIKYFKQKYDDKKFIKFQYDVHYDIDNHNYYKLYFFVDLVFSRDDEFSDMKNFCYDQFSTKILRLLDSKKFKTKIVSMRDEIMKDLKICINENNKIYYKQRKYKNNKDFFNIVFKNKVKE